MEADPSRIFLPQTQSVYRQIEPPKQYCQIIFKLMEMILCIVCMVTINDPVQNSRFHVFITQTTVAICYATYGSHLMYSVIFLVGKLTHHEWPWKSTSALACIATTLFIMCTISLAKDWSDAKERYKWPPNQPRLDLLFAAAISSAINATIYFFDAMFIVISATR